MHISANGRVAAVIHPDYAASRAQPGTQGAQGAHYGGGLYFHYDRGVGFAPVMGLDHPVDGDDSACNGVFGDVALCENNGLLAVASHTARGPGGRSAKSLLHLSSPWDSRPVARPLMTTGDYLRGSDHQLSGIGIIDVSPAGHFGMSTHFVPPRATSTMASWPGTSPRPPIISCWSRPPS